MIDWLISVAWAVVAIVLYLGAMRLLGYRMTKRDGGA